MIGGSRDEVCNTMLSYGSTNLEIPIIFYNSSGICHYLPPYPCHRSGYLQSLRK